MQTASVARITGRFLIIKLYCAKFICKKFCCLKYLLYFCPEIKK